MNVLITSGPTREPIDPVRYLGNRSSGKMGMALANAALRAGHRVTMILGPMSAQAPEGIRQINVETARQMLQAVMQEMPQHDLLIMAAAVSDFRVKQAAAEKISRGGNLTLELEPTEDIVAAAAGTRRADQRVVGFSLEGEGGEQRAGHKLALKKLDLIVYNPLSTMGSEMVEATLLYADGRREKLSCRPKSEFADILIQRSADLF